MNYFEKILSIDYGSHGLSSIDQLVFIKISYNVLYELGLSTKELCLSCSTSKPTLLVSISTLESIGFISVQRSPGVVSSFSLNYEFIDTLYSSFVNANDSLDLLVLESKALFGVSKLTKNQKKRLKRSGRRC